MIQCTNGRVAKRRRLGRIPQVFADQIVALTRHPLLPAGPQHAILIHARAVLLGENAEVADELVGRGEAVDVHDLGTEDRGRGGADPGNRQDRVGGQSRGGFHHCRLDLVFNRDTLAKLTCELTHQRRRFRALEAAHGRSRRGLQALGLVGAEVRDGGQRIDASAGERRRQRIAIEQLQDPAGLKIGGLQGQLRKDPRQKIVELVDETRALTGLRFQPADGLTQGLQRRRGLRMSAWLLLKGEAGGTVAFDRVGLALGKSALR